MDKLKLIIDFVRSLPIAGKVISLIIIILFCVVMFFFSGCSYKLSFDNLETLDNFTHEIEFGYPNGNK